MDKETKLNEKKGIIIEALKRCLQKDVYSKITIQDVADEAGFSKGGLLHYFSSKEDLYLELIKNIFGEIEKDQQQVIDVNMNGKEKASISALFSVEKFFLDQSTVKIFLNLILYGFENEKIMSHIKNFIHYNLSCYEDIINQTRNETPSRRKTDMDSTLIARIAQITVIAAGIFESIDPIIEDHTSIIKYVLSLLKG